MKILLSMLLLLAGACALETAPNPHPRIVDMRPAQLEGMPVIPAPPTLAFGDDEDAGAGPVELTSQPLTTWAHATFVPNHVDPISWGSSALQTEGKCICSTFDGQNFVLDVERENYIQWHSALYVVYNATWYRDEQTNIVHTTMYYRRSNTQTWTNLGYWLHFWGQQGTGYFSLTSDGQVMNQTARCDIRSDSYWGYFYNNWN